MFRIYQDSTPSCACSQNCGGRWVRRAVVIADTFFLYCKEGQNPLQKEKSAQESRGEMEITTQTAVWRPSSFRTRQHCLFVYNMAGAEEKEGEDQTERQTEGGEGNTMEGGEDAQYETTKEQMVPFEGCEEAFWKAKDPKFILQVRWLYGQRRDVLGKGGGDRASLRGLMVAGGVSGFFRHWALGLSSVRVLSVGACDVGNERDQAGAHRVPHKGLVNKGGNVWASRAASVITSVKATN
uniref:Uncharacterized protein n=1 Tax=Chromera velia CCMP2878 TaxID=1169474 RepID=A0A0K6S821_9ALVE|eukprot:Cvel_23055.t2-p1 / transcript=Cvel_23055.t2 / gene=Cvel_23055 / organism=Chromera_velia_CCMP2878 / gene_product=hypothetical protein / transcript_product=hypothetical protein / location=Cvel_scaffold2333:10462-12371(+) / protein_length=238 / sequence_SO=supercontig / SO=protein_coding / is_pseudo=false